MTGPWEELGDMAEGELALEAGIAKAEGDEETYGRLQEFLRDYYERHLSPPEPVQRPSGPRVVP